LVPQENIRLRGVRANAAATLELYDTFRHLRSQTEMLRAQRNALTAKIKVRCLLSGTPWG
jgi:seryl-tRNA synthetase